MKDKNFCIRYDRLPLFYYFFGFNIGVSFNVNMKDIKLSV